MADEEPKKRWSTPAKNPGDGALYAAAADRIRARVMGLIGPGAQAALTAQETPQDRARELVDRFIYMNALDPLKARYRLDEDDIAFLRNGVTSADKLKGLRDEDFARDQPFQEFIADYGRRLIGVAAKRRDTLADIAGDEVALGIIETGARNALITVFARKTGMDGSTQADQFLRDLKADLRGAVELEMGPLPKGI